MLFRHMLQYLLQKLVFSRQKEIPFIIFSWFLLSFVISRMWVLGMQFNIIPDMYLIIRGVHVHHLNYGIFVLALIGFIALSFRGFTEKHVHGLSIIYGCGLGLLFDEFAMWLLLDDVYWERITYDAIIVVSLLFLNIIYFKGFWLYIIRKIRIKKITQLRLFQK